MPQGHPGQFPAQTQGTAATYSQLRMQQQQIAMQANAGAAGGPMGPLPPMAQMAQPGMVMDSTKALLHQRMLQQQQQALLKQQMGSPAQPGPMSPQTHLLAGQPQGGAHSPDSPHYPSPQVQPQPSPQHPHPAHSSSPHPGLGGPLSGSLEQGHMGTPEQSAMLPQLNTPNRGGLNSDLGLAGDATGDTLEKFVEGL
ncbi:hypothetical protein KUCAC02_016108 [Chaenocephalus aceratus]|uniref:Uncharacterized protein n=1 Tax=Chaenocephalus aceratus TaxID=36190 RepID=A0ACB9Y043_CHAAC|nr:hypothetical protein KUCAC02_016108 [Chaenocephalus aceratus]